MTVIPLSPALDDLLRRASQVRSGDDPEGPHGLRVATRRLDVWLRLGGWRVLRDDLRWLRGVAGVVRDADVRRLATRRRDADDRDGATVALVAALDSPRFVALREALAACPPMGAAAARRRAAAVVRAPAARQPDSAAGVHDLRRRIRRARYALEWLGEPIGPLPGLQDSLGEVSDRLLLGHPLRRADLALGREVRAAVRTFLGEWC